MLQPANYRSYHAHLRQWGGELATRELQQRRLYEGRPDEHVSIVIDDDALARPLVEHQKLWCACDCILCAQKLEEGALSYSSCGLHCLQRQSLSSPELVGGGVVSGLCCTLTLYYCAEDQAQPGVPGFEKVGELENLLHEACLIWQMAACRLSCKHIKLPGGCPKNTPDR